jgi:N-acetylglucosaminyldiphosphoundecaprenol N-acetyl-beta-D-mannosaminyltransferase
MFENYFNLRFCFDRKEVVQKIDERLLKDGSDYITVADGVVLYTINRNPEYMRVTNEAMFSICDSSFVPLYIKWIYGVEREQYSGSMIFEELITSKKYRMFFLGAREGVLSALKQNLVENYNAACANMTFMSLPFNDVNDFDYPTIAKKIEEDKADIVWVSLGAPKQDIFMNLLRPHLHHGVMLGVGAAFKFYSGFAEKRAPEWMIKHHLEFVYRIFQDPKKQLIRCGWIIYMLPKMFFEELKRMHKNKHKNNNI